MAIDFLDNYIPEPNSGCWIWLGPMSSGYPSCDEHRKMYERKHGKIAKKLDIHHKCENTFCINPDHLEALSKSEHLLRHRQLKPYGLCKNGHDLSKTRYAKTDNRRMKLDFSYACRECMRIARKRYRVKKNAATTFVR